MILEMEKVRKEKYYKIGYISKIDKYVLAVVIAWIAWYYRYYEISEEEYALYEKDVERLDLLADEVYHSKTKSERFLFSEKMEENSKEQQERCNICYKE